MITKFNTTRTTTTRTVVQFDRADLMAAIRHLMPNLPADATLSVQVPGGGDWSNCNLEIGEDVDRLNVSYEQTKVTQEEG